MFQKDLSISLLFDFYGDILTDRKKEIFIMYYNEDMSLAEIADETGISRQGVRDSLKKTERELFELENKLGLASKFERVKTQIVDIKNSLADISQGLYDDESKRLLSDIISELDSLDI